ncbi:MAG: DUF1311 domain-containing protein [Gammaproteobacteria bacterium]|nr:DUF1311 domain-containing protein [Gammaproteobacteria bacterium]
MRHTATCFLAPHLLIVAVLSGWSMSLQADHPSMDYQSIVDGCLRNPANRIGGAAIGGCLQKKVSKLQSHIDTKLNEIATRVCPAHQERLYQTQQQWLDYQQNFCQLLPSMHDNNAMYINSQSCALRLSLARHGDLNYFKNNLSDQASACP